MYEGVKICPECDAEFFAHAEECNACGVRLISPEQKERLRRNLLSSRLSVLLADQLADHRKEEFVCINEGDITTLHELSKVLQGSGIACEVVSRDITNRCPGGGFSLLVPKLQKDAALKIMEEYWERVHPELKLARAREDEGACPGCGTMVKDNPSVCPGCGLNLAGGTDDDRCPGC